MAMPPSSKGTTTLGQCHLPARGAHCHPRLTSWGVQSEFFKGQAERDRLNLIKPRLPSVKGFANEIQGYTAICDFNGRDVVGQYCNRTVLIL